MGRPMAEISVGRLLSQLFQITHQFNMETQPQLLMLQKTMVLAEGVGRNLDDSSNMWVLTQPLIEDWMIANRSAYSNFFINAVIYNCTASIFNSFIDDWISRPHIFCHLDCSSSMVDYNARISTVSNP